METRRRLSDYKIPYYTKNFGYFDRYLSNHRPHQIEAFWKALESNKGQIISPCGTGKTRIQASIHVQEMIRLNQNYDCGIFVIASHRLSLNRQLLNQVVDVAVNCGLPFDVLYVGSFKCDLNKYYTKYHHLGYGPRVSRHLASTNPKAIENFIQRARDEFRNVIVASTYDSFVCLKNIGLINITTYDEAHNTTQNDFKKNILEVKPNIMAEYYFTATRKIAGVDGGMNDKDFYGDILYDACPRLMLAAGEIVCPRLHRIKSQEGETTNATNTDMLIKNTIEAYRRHRQYVKRVSCDPDKIGAKLLIGCDGIVEMKRIYNDPTLKLFASTMQAFAISSEGSYVNWEPCTKEEFFTKLNDLSDTEDAIIFNVDMLTEGIDLPSITGVMPLRNLGQTKLIQLIGRALRLHKLDRDNLYNTQLSPCDYTNYVKPYGYLVIPEHLASIDHYGEMIKIAGLFYSEYGTKAEQLLIDEKFIDHQPNELKSMIPFNFDSGKNYDLEHSESDLIDEINLHRLKEDLANLNDAEKEEYIRGIL